MPSLHNRELILQVLHARRAAPPSPAPAAVVPPLARIRWTQPVRRDAEFRDRVMALLRAGCTYTQASVRLDVSRNVIAGIVYQYRKRGGA